MIPREEWLQDAQALPVGRSERVYHGAERRQNMLVKNKPDGWACWCFSCQDGGFVPKEHVRLQEPDEPDVPEIATALVRLGYNPSVLLHELWRMQVPFPDGTAYGICIIDNNKMFVPYFGIEQLAVELRDGKYSRMQKAYKKPDWFS